MEALRGGRFSPRRKIFPTPPPKGTVHVSLLRSAFQFAVMMGELVRYRPPGML